MMTRNKLTNSKMMMVIAVLHTLHLPLVPLAGKMHRTHKTSLAKRCNSICFDQEVE